MYVKQTSIVKKVITRIIAVFIALYLIIWLASSPIIKHFLTAPLAELGLKLSSNSSISYNPFLSQLALQNVTIIKQNEAVFSVKELKIQIALYKLVVDKIEFQKLFINELYLRVEQNSQGITLAGVSLPSTTDSTTDGADEIAKKIEKDSTFNYQISLPKLEVLKSKIELNIKQNEKVFHHKLLLSKLLITDVLAAQTFQQGEITLEAKIDQAPLTLDADISFERGTGTLKSDFNVSTYPLSSAQHFVKAISPIEKLSGELSFSSSQTVTIAPSEIKINIAKASLSNKDLILNQAPFSINLKKFTSDFSDFELVVGDNLLAKLSGNAEVQLSKALVHAQTPEQELLTFETLSFGNIAVKTANKTQFTPEVSIEKITLDELISSRNTQSELPPIASINQININNIVASPMQLTLDKINLDSLIVDVILDKDKKLQNLIAFNDELTEPKKVIADAEVAPPLQADNEITKDAEHTFDISINEVSFGKNSQINFTDNSVEPIYQRNFFVDNLTLGELSSFENQRENSTPFAISGRSNQYAKFQFNGFVKPFSTIKTYQLKGNLTELSLPAVSSYLKDSLELAIKSGQLNTALDVTLTGEEIDGDINIVIKGLETSVAENYQTGTIKDKSALPLNAALGMLMDSKGDLELDVPLSGSTSDPEFGISSIITLITKKAVMSATESYLMQTFVPYANIVSVAMTAGDYLLKVRFEDLPYKEKQITPDEQQQSYIDQFIALMKDKSDTQVKICAISTPADIGLELGKEVTDKAALELLRTLGGKRENAFKELVIKQGGIESSRLLLCTPQIDTSKGALPRLSIAV